VGADRLHAQVQPMGDFGDGLAGHQECMCKLRQNGQPSPQKIKHLVNRSVHHYLTGMDKTLHVLSIRRDSTENRRAWRMRHFVA
jgi:hypothetical protein